MTFQQQVGPDWQVAPAEHEISNYDEPKISYRKYVQEFIEQFPKKSIRKKNFFTIATNVLCADKESSKPEKNPIDRDIYLPLEISITKWSLYFGKDSPETKPMMTKVWMINPGPPTHQCLNVALDHRAKHKIDFDHDDHESNVYIETDLTKIMKEINSFLTPDRTVFSIELKHIRQDLGSLKWLTRESECNSKTIRFFSLEDLYVVLARLFTPPELGDMIGQGLARHRMTLKSDCYDPERQCAFHQAKGKLTDGETRNCAKAVSSCFSEVLREDIHKFTLSDHDE